MAPNPGQTSKSLNDTLAGWEEHAADAMFSGLTLAQYKAKVKASLDARDQIKDLQLQLDAARIERDNADVVSEEITAGVVNSVKGDPNHGEDSPLYASFGYVRKSARKSGLTRATNNMVTPPAELKVAA